MIDCKLTQTAPLLVVSKLVKTVATGDSKLTILQGLNLEINTGESVAITGASGSGKSTLLGIMAGLDTASSGEVELLGNPITQMNEDERAAVRASGVGFVFQNFQLLPGLTATENVSLPIEMQGHSVTKARQSAQQWLDKVGLSHRYTHYPKQLSGGEQQRVAIARAFACQPKILFADEPTGNLDKHTGHDIIEQLFELNKAHQTTLVLVTHDDYLASRCDRRIHLDNG